MANVQAFRAHAEKYLSMARENANSDQRAQFLQTAQSWVAMAERTERLARRVKGQV